jgi:hypothetical protein
VDFCHGCLVLVVLMRKSWKVLCYFTSS